MESDSPVYVYVLVFHMVINQSLLYYNKPHLLPAWTTSTVLKSTCNRPSNHGSRAGSAKYCYFGQLKFILPLYHILPEIMPASTYFATNCYLFCRHNAYCQQVPIMAGRLGSSLDGGGQQASCLVAKQAVEFPQVLAS